MPYIRRVVNVPGNLDTFIDILLEVKRPLYFFRLSLFYLRNKSVVGNNFSSFLDWINLNGPQKKKKSGTPGKNFKLTSSPERIMTLVVRNKNHLHKKQKTRILSGPGAGKEEENHTKKSGARAHPSLT